MNEASGSGSYPGPGRRHWLNKTVQGNAVRQRLTPHQTDKRPPSTAQHDRRQSFESSGQKHHASGVERKSPKDRLRKAWSVGFLPVIPARRFSTAVGLVKQESSASAFNELQMLDPGFRRGDE
jgi:hypothetical protein